MSGLGTRIIRAREARRWSQEDLASCANLSRKALSDIECDKCNPPNRNA